MWFKLCVLNFKVICYLVSKIVDLKNSIKNNKFYSKFYLVLFITGLPLYLEKPGIFNNFNIFKSKISISNKNSIL